MRFRVMKSIPKGTEFSKQFSKEFGTIFRSNGDRNTVRKLPTPAPEDIKTNLHNFLKRWNNFLKLDELKGTVSEIELLRIHIKKGCLSGLLPGEGTEPNESLSSYTQQNTAMWTNYHRTRTGVCYPDSPVLRYQLQNRWKKHIGNSRIIPFIPLLASHENDNVHLGKVRTTTFKPEVPTIQNTVVVVENMQDMCNDMMSKLLLKNTEKLILY